MATAEQIANVKMEVGDMDVTFPMLSDTEYTYFIDKNDASIRRASLDCARAILFKLSMRGDETVDIFSLKGSKAAEAYRMALMLYIKNPEFNPVMTSASIYAGGISLSDMQSNVDTTDNNYVRTANEPESYTYPPLDNPFVV